MRATFPIVSGIQRFDEKIVPYQFEASSTSPHVSGFEFIAESLRTNSGPAMSNMMIWSDNSNKAYATQRPPIKRAFTLDGAFIGNDYEAEVLADSPIIYYRMSARADTSGTSSETNEGSGISAAVYNFATAPTTVQGLIRGDFDTAKSFGTDNTARLEVAATTDGEAGTTGWTFECLITPTADDVGAGTATIWTRNAIANNTTISIDGSGNVVYQIGAATTITGGTTLVAGTTYQIIAVREAGAGSQDLRLFVSPTNGSLTEDATAVSTSVTDTGSAPSTIGAENGGGSDDFHGVIDEISIYATDIGGTRRTAHFDAIQGTAFPTASGIGRAVRKITSASGNNDEIVIVGGTISGVTKPIGGIPLVASAVSLLPSIAKFPDGIHKVYTDQISDSAIGIVIPSVGASGFDANKLLSFTDDSGFGQINDHTNFLPSDVNLAGGFVFFNGRAYILDTRGRIYTSSDTTLNVWNTLDFLTAERDFDGGRFIARHHDTLVAFGDKTIEFFVDNANPTGSPLIRNEISYRVGLIGDVTQVEDILYFIGQAEGGDFGLYKIEQFQVTKISDERVNYKFEAMALGGFPLTLSGFTVAGRHIISIVQTNVTTADGVSTSNLKDNVMFDVKYGALYDWSSTESELDPQIVDTAISGGAITRQGTLINLRNTLATTMEDDNNASLGGDDDGIPDTPIAIEWSITSPNLTMGSHRNKFWMELGVEGTFGHRQSASDPVTIDLSWSDDFYETFETPITVDFSGYKFAEYGLGSSQHRVWKIEGNTKARILLQNWVMEWNEGDN